MRGDDGSRYDHMMDFIDPSAPKTKDYIRKTRNENQKERISPYLPSIDSKLANLFLASIPDDKENTNLVDWSYLDRDDGLPGEPADWVKKQIRQLEKWGDDELHKEMLEEMKRIHQWTHNIPPPSTPKRYDPNELPFNPADTFGEMDSDLDE